jgi:holo-[acyl-carrier protein] synthase
MQIIGHGIDIVEVAAIERLLRDPDDDFISAWFTSAETELAPSGPAGRSTYFAGQLAAKEAVVKALGTGLIGEMAWTDIEILRQSSGAPNVVLSCETARVADSSGVTKWLVSISHAEQFAIASAIALHE